MLRMDGCIRTSIVYGRHQRLLPIYIFSLHIKKAIVIFSELLMENLSCPNVTNPVSCSFMNVHKIKVAQVKIFNCDHGSLAIF